MPFKVSIVLPVHNGEKYIETCVKSIINQTHRNFELIIVDDASSDSTNCIVNNLALLDGRIRILKNKRNLKLPESLNRGFSNADGVWATWISHDNILEENFLQLMLEASTKSKADCVYTDYKLIDSNGEILGMAKMRSPENLNYGNCVGASFLYRLSIHNALNGYDVTKFLYEDYDFWIRMKNSGFHMTHVAISPYRYRLHEEQLSVLKRYPRDFVKFRWNLLHQAVPADPKRISSATISVIGLALRTRNPDLGVIYFLKSARHWNLIIKNMASRIGEIKK